MSGQIQITAQEVRKTSTTQAHPLGTAAVITGTDKVYRYARAGAVALDPGKVVINADLVSNHTNRTVVAAEIGAKEVQVNIGATAMTADQYKDGVLTVNDSTGEGINYQVEGNVAHAGSGAASVFLKEGLKVALVASASEVTLKLSNWADVVISIADQADMAVGVPNVSVAIGGYFWAQTRGECAVLADEAVVKGCALVLGSSTVGSVETCDTDDVVQHIGVASEALVDTEYRSAYLQID